MDTKLLLEQLTRRAFDYFWHEAHPDTGFVKDRAHNHEPDEFVVSSIAASGFALAVLPIAVRRGWVDKAQAVKRAEQTLESHLPLPHQRGWLYHFIHWETGERQWNCEVSSIDTGLLVMGALIAAEGLDTPALRKQAQSLYERVDFTWMLTDGGARPAEKTLSMGWKPETGFLASRWDHYSEHMFLYLLAMGSPTYPIPAECWEAWQRPLLRYQHHAILFGGPLFLHQMSHVFIDFRGKRDRLSYNYWIASRNATLAQRAFCIEMACRYKTYSEDVWGLTASDGPDGYRAYGAPGDIEHDGTVAPTAAITSLIFTPEESLKALRAIYERYHPKLWGRYGFGNAFNVERDWWDREVIGIDLGMMTLAIGNYETRLIWELSARIPAIQRGLKAAGFRAVSEDERRAPIRRV
ncbi:hypothetical protein GBSOP10_11098 [Armatimonadetes bacterium GBS]|jgi:hypothetical protein|nr:hypothetical protein GBSOP10_11098 [Armatimonadetes bacterium GBS]CUU34485.1 hypothetical protein GXSOP10_11658 [Armatimonadetes bacterium GXS]